MNYVFVDYNDVCHDVFVITIIILHFFILSALVKVNLESSINLDMNLKINHIIKCPYKGDNVKSVKWFRSDTGLLPSNMIVNVSSLVIRNAQLSDSGLYTCKVEGQINTDQKSINLTVYRK